MSKLKSVLCVTLLLLGLGPLAGSASTNSFPATSQFKGRAVQLSGDVYRPDGPGPFPAVVLLHGCAGIRENHHQWAELLREWGYVALVLDSLGPRGLRQVCTKSKLSTKTRAVDAYDAKAYLASLPYVRADKIALMGWSHGGMATLWAADTALASAGDPFQAYVAMYPRCRRPMSGLRGPLLILAGAQDDLAQAALCQQLATTLMSRKQYPVTIKIFPNATHAWDVDRPPRSVRGHKFAYDPEATKGSHAMVRKFLAEYLGGR